jgi:hypothetical protein
MIKIGWIGCGTHASEMLLPQLVRFPVKIAAVCDVDGKRLAQIGDRYGVNSRYTDAAQLIAHEGLDAIGMAVGLLFMSSWVYRRCRTACRFSWKNRRLRLRVPLSALLMKPHVPAGLALSAS